MPRRFALLVLLVPALQIGFGLVPARASRPLAPRTIVPDSVFSSHHPRLLFSPSMLPALRAKVTDGGYDDDAWARIQSYASGLYANYAAISQLGGWYGLETFPNLALAGWLSVPQDTSALAIGRKLTHVLVDNYEPDYDEAGSGMRLRALALGYDAFFLSAPDSERAVIRNEMVRYIDRMTGSLAYELFEYPPYLANHSAMFGAALGLAAIALAGETDPARVQAALAMADRIADSMLLQLFDEFGAYGEGGFYALWSMRNLVYYFDARERYDGVRWADRPRLRALETWLAYELLPEGSARSLNINDSAYYSRPFALVPTYFAWAMSAWNSSLSAWMFEHIAGVLGHEFGEQADQAGRVLWWNGIPETSPAAVLPPRRVFPDAGLYHFRTGWPAGASSGDVVFAFHCGRFRGGHAQEDQGQFVLHGYGTYFAVDHGPGSAVAKQSESHNIILIDGAGQHNAGSSIGTDGKITAYIEGGLADYVAGDATSAYATHSHYNDPNRPVDGIDWSWGYAGANPVLYARRRVVSVYDGTHTPYFLILDDIQKNDAPHAYSWRMHTSNANTISAGAWPLLVQSGSATLAVHLVRPDTAAVSVTLTPYDNLTPEANSTVIALTQTAVDGRFGVLLVPRPAAMAQPVVAQTAYPWGHALTLDFGDATVDRILVNESGDTASFAGVATDAPVAVVRTRPGSPPSYLAVSATFLDIDGARHLDAPGAPVSVSLRAGTLSVDSWAATWRVLDTGITALRYRTAMLPFVVSAGYVTRSVATNAGTDTHPPAALEIRAWPNPANPVVHLAITTRDPGRALTVDVFDVRGRRVRRLFTGVRPAGSTPLRWNGRDDAGRDVASGVYFARAVSGVETATARIVIIR